MAVLQLRTTNADYTYHLYYQHSSGEIRDLELNNYQWVPAAYTNVGLPVSVRNGTPMAVASYENSAPWSTVPNPNPNGKLSCAKPVNLVSHILY